jgi:hypothetical protein
MMKKIFGTLQIVPPRHYGTPVIARISAKPAAVRIFTPPREQKTAGIFPGHLHLKTDS